MEIYQEMLQKYPHLFSIRCSKSKNCCVCQCILRLFVYFYFCIHDHNGPESLKKFRPKKPKKFIDQIPFFAISKMAKYQFLN